MKDTFYFSHDYNARSDDKIKRLIPKHGILGYGTYWAIIEDLYNNANALRTDYEGIAFDLRVDEELVKSIINDFDLFVIDGEEFGSMSVQNRIDARNEKSKRARENANKRWSKNATALKNDATALPLQSESNAIKERKGKERKNILLESAKSPPTGVDPLHFYIAKGFHNLFLKKGRNKTLTNAKLSKWVNDTRLLLNVDKVPLTQLIAIKRYWELCQEGARGTDSFWFDTVNSIATFRKVDKEGVYHYDKITLAVKKWLAKNPDAEREILDIENKLITRVNG